MRYKEFCLCVSSVELIWGKSWREKVAVIVVIGSKLTSHISEIITNKLIVLVCYGLHYKNNNYIGTG